MGSPTSQRFNTLAPPGDIQHMTMADKKEIDINGAKYSVKKANATPHASDITINGVTYSINMARFSVQTNMTFSLLQWLPTMFPHLSTLIRQGPSLIMVPMVALQEKTVMSLKKMHPFGNVEGIDSHVMEKCPIVTAGGVTNSNKGPIILIMNQYALSGKGISIHSLPQMEWYSVNVDDRSMKVGGKQQLKVIDGFVIPLNITCSLP